MRSSRDLPKDWCTTSTVVQGMTVREQKTSLELIAAPMIEKRIFVVRGRQVMLDQDLAVSRTRFHGDLFSWIQSS
jgi:hypothetical protein